MRFLKEKKEFICHSQDTLMIMQDIEQLQAKEKSQSQEGKQGVQIQQNE